LLGGVAAGEVRAFGKRCLCVWRHAHHYLVPGAQHKVVRHAASCVCRSRPRSTARCRLPEQHDTNAAVLTFFDEIQHRTRLTAVPSELALANPLIPFIASWHLSA
jgi:hypothetical protein